MKLNLLGQRVVPKRFVDDPDAFLASGPCLCGSERRYLRVFNADVILEEYRVLNAHVVLEKCTECRRPLAARLGDGRTVRIEEYLSHRREESPPQKEPKARTLEEIAEFRRAVEIVRGALEEEPEHRDALMLLGTLYEQQGLRLRARAIFERLGPEPEPPKVA